MYDPPNSIEALLIDEITQLVATLGLDPLAAWIIGPRS
jgi:hypothetical protein